MPAKTDLSRLNCSLARALGAVGDWWTMLIVRDAFMGVDRFGEFQKSTGIARNILANRLQALVDDGILAKQGTSERPLYQLTQKGYDLLPALVALMQWGDKWQSAGTPPVELTDAEGEAVARVSVQSATGQAVTADTIRFRPGPGASKETQLFLSGLAKSAAADAASRRRDNDAFGPRPDRHARKAT